MYTNCQKRRSATPKSFFFFATGSNFGTPPTNNGSTTEQALLLNMSKQLSVMFNISIKQVTRTLKCLLTRNS